MPRKVELSGAEKRKRARQKKADALRAELAKLGYPVEPPPPASGAPVDTGASDFAELEGPDLDNPHTDLDYVRRVQLVALDQVIRDPELPRRDRWRLIREMSAVLGMTHPRAVLEAEVKRLRAALAVYKTPKAIQTAPGGTVPRPPTARGGSRSRGPRALPPAPPPPPANPEPEGDQPA